MLILALHIYYILYIYFILKHSQSNTHCNSTSTVALTCLEYKIFLEISIKQKSRKKLSIKNLERDITKLSNLVNYCL